VEIAVHLFILMGRVLLEIRARGKEDVGLGNMLFLLLMLLGLRMLGRRLDLQRAII
jgi:hypothetical protein